MYRLHSIDLRRFLLLQEASFKFRSGITQVGGENRVGKSLLFSGLQPLLYPGDADYKLPKGSAIDLNFDSVNTEGKIDEWKFGAKVSGSTKFSIFRGEEDMSPHIIKDAKRLINETWVLPYDLYNSTVYISGVQSHPLSTGTPAKRSEWLAGVLDLVSVYDNYMDEVSAKLKSLGTVQTEVTVLRDELDNLRAPEDLGVGKVSVEQLEKRLRVWARKETEASSELRKLTAERDQVAAAVRLPRKPKGTASIKELEQLRDNTESMLRQWSAYIKQENHNQVTLDRLGLLKKRLKGKEPSAALIKKRRGLLATLVAQHEQYEAEYAEWEGQSDARKLRRKIEKSGFIPKCGSTHESRKRHAQEAATLSYLEQSLQSLQAVDGQTTCPTCGSDLDKEHLQLEVAQLEKKIRICKKRTEAWRKEEIYHTNKEVELIEKPVKPTRSPDTLREWLDSAEEYLHLKAELGGGVEEPTMDEGELRTTLSSITSQLKALRAWKEAGDNIPEEILKLSSEGRADLLNELEDKVEAAYQQSREYQSKIIDGKATLQTYETQKKVIRNYRAQHTRLRDSIAEREERTKDIPALKALQVAFGATGLRLMQLQESAHVFESKLTELSGLFFDDPYNFRVHVAPRKLDIIIERNGIEGTLPTLSGSERRAWSLLCAMALLYILPGRLRCDSIILDEVEANMHKKARDRYTQEVLPEIKSLVDKVVVVTPLVSGELRLVPDWNYTVVKSNKGGKFKSRLVEG